MSTHQKQFDFEAGLVTYNVIRSTINPPNSEARKLSHDSEEIIARELPHAEARALQRRLDKEAKAKQIADTGHHSSWTCPLHTIQRVEIPSLATAARDARAKLH